MSSTQDAYTSLEQRFHRLSVLADVSAVLHWDHAVMMPPGGAEARAEQLAHLDVLRHELLSHPDVADLLNAAEQDGEDHDDWRRANLREMGRRWRHTTALSADLTEVLSKAASRCEMAWRDARADDDFAAVEPHLQGVLRLVREAAAAKAEALGCAPYDALLDSYDAGLRQARIAPIFAELRQFLPDFLDDVLACQARPPPSAPRLSVTAQEAFARRFMTLLGFDFTNGRLDTSHHPFTGGVREDVRLTTRFDDEDFISGLMAVLHETGHALYERGLPSAWRHQPVGASMGMTVHESQSLIIEMQACRSDAFFSLLHGALREHARDAGQTTAPHLALLYRRVERGLIRVDADEVSYPLHVILRYELEQALFAGDLAVADLPGAWRDGMAALLGIAPDDDRDGCLQDVHWYGGDFGYFPTYTLGAIAAAQLFQAATAAAPGIPTAIAAGDFAPLTTWLGDNVHQRGHLHASADDLLSEATGRPLDVTAFKAHLIARYGS